MKKWEIELQTLRESNARLTTALQESAASVEQWRRQCCICRDENDRLRNKVGTGGLPWRGPWEGSPHFTLIPTGKGKTASPSEPPSTPITDLLLL